MRDPEVRAGRESRSMRRGCGTTSGHPRSIGYVSVLVALAAFGFVAAVRPGPNNLRLWASGASFGFRRTLPHLVGTALGLGGMALGVAVGLGAIVSTTPALTLAMRAGAGR